ncbi:MAG: ribonuclease HII [Candidatus Colwellbacteria bacterium CG10_big_fil_rev_8_21_14_0_10_42_22]|uniref:Ribonuclease n=1 Tax=Candidatus Colwellbacteria bacterium CG10_big_fil_rev_8_21_14_0_10_42_22 TaxID=1974540 RepID=A0A2H0VF89_9BACT|nr:MAG: ribonuclease HII [Candidatus Colwellbacteria bacterium CG10_big_fil_rev_8_21_14_0_10_42_22]
MDYIVGIDEAGRGALAGPVVVGVVAIPKGFKISGYKLPKLKDSKGLSANQRSLWYTYIRKHPQIFFASARVYQRRIDKINITQSSNVAASRALDNLFKEIPRKRVSKVLLDGGLYLGSIEHMGIASKTIVRGDEKHNPIKLASIVAKVTRDKYLEKLDFRYPQYGLARHKGYGTKAHFKAIKEHGILEMHRLTFLKEKIKN